MSEQLNTNSFFGQGPTGRIINDIYNAMGNPAVAGVSDFLMRANNPLLAGVTHYAAESMGLPTGSPNQLMRDVLDGSIKYDIGDQVEGTEKFYAGTNYAPQSESTFIQVTGQKPKRAQKTGKKKPARQQRKDPVDQNIPLNPPPTELSRPRETYAQSLNALGDLAERMAPMYDKRNEKARLGRIEEKLLGDQQELRVADRIQASRSETERTRAWRDIRVAQMNYQALMTNNAIRAAALATYPNAGYLAALGQSTPQFQGANLGSSPAPQALRTLS